MAQNVSPLVLLAGIACIAVGGFSLINQNPAQSFTTNSVSTSSNTKILGIRFQDYKNAQWDEYKPGYSGKSLQEAENIWMRKKGQITYVANLSDVSNAQASVTVRMCSELDRENENKRNGQIEYSSDTTLLVNGKSAGSQNVTADDGIGKEYTWTVPSGLLKNGENEITFSVNGKYANGLTIFSPITIRIESAQFSNNSSINVPLSTPWTSTGISVKSGQNISITASGKGVWKNIPGKNPNSYPKPYEECDPNGTAPVDSKDYYSNISSYSTKDAYKGALIGKIGENGKPFKVGTQFNQTINESGILYLGINDMKPEADSSSFSDNSGSYAAIINVR